jgi:hypothetical protein
MKFFDYKIIILLGLTLVVYFLYKELEFLRSKVDKLEQNYLKTNDTKPKINKPVLPLPNQQPKIKDQTLKTPPNIVSLNVVNSMAKTSPKVINIDLSSTIPLDDTENITTTLSESIKQHIAIYSNDNEQFEETEKSLLESMESVKRQKENPNPEIKNVEHNIDKLIESLTKSETAEQKESSTETEVTKKYTEVELDKMKLVELKKISESYKIEVNKNVNGNMKPKTKKELITEILTSQV